VGAALGYDVAAFGDVDGDAVGDFGSIASYGALIWSGADGQPLLSFPQGQSSVSRLGDLDLDGLEEVLFGRAQWSTGRVKVFSGGSFQVMYDLVQNQPWVVFCLFITN
jgi:hypothetical protein